MNSLSIRYYHLNKVLKMIILLQLLLSLSKISSQRSHVKTIHSTNVVAAVAATEISKDLDGDKNAPAPKKQHQQEQQKNKAIVPETTTVHSTLEANEEKIKFGHETELWEKDVKEDKVAKRATLKDDKRDDFFDSSTSKPGITGKRTTARFSGNNDENNVKNIPLAEDSGTRSNIREKETKDTTKKEKITSNKNQIKYPGDHAILFPPNDEYDITDFHYFNENYDQETNYDIRSSSSSPVVHSASPYGGYSRSSRSRLAKLPLRFYNGDDETQEKDDVNEKTINDNSYSGNEFYLNVRDGMGRLYVCKWYHENELTSQAISRSVFDHAPLVDEEGAETYYNDWRKSSINANSLSEFKAARNKKNSDKLGVALNHILSDLVNDIEERGIDLDVGGITFDLNELMAEEGFDVDDVDMNNPDHADAIARAFQRHLNNRRAVVVAGGHDGVQDVDVVEEFDNFLTAVKNAIFRVIGAITGKNDSGNDGIHRWNHGSDGVGENLSPTPTMTPSNKSNNISKNRILNHLKKKLHGRCSQVHKGWWSYEWCFEDAISQFHVELIKDPETETSTIKTASTKDSSKPLSTNLAAATTKEPPEYKIEPVVRLGSYNPAGPEFVTIEVPNHGKYAGKTIIRTQQTYDKGEYCEDAGRERIVTAVYRCCYDDSDNSSPSSKSDANGLVTLQDVAEEETCVYTALVCTKLLCDDDILNANIWKSDHEENYSKNNGDSVASKQESHSKATMTKDGSEEYEYTDGYAASVEDTTSAGKGGIDTFEFPNTRSNNSNDPLAKNQLEQQHNNKSSLQDESIRQILDRTLGRFCLQKDAGWWKYEFCHSRYASEFHVEVSLDPKTGRSIISVEDENKLGLFDLNSGLYPRSEEALHVLDLDVWDINNKSNTPQGTKSVSKSYEFRSGGTNTPAFIQEYPNGDYCTHSDVIKSTVKGGAFNTEGRGVQRSSTARFICGPKYELVNVEEDTTCHYLFDITVPDLCHHSLFRTTVLESRVLKCLPARE